MNANQQYQERRNEINKAIEILKQQLEAMDIAQAKDQKNYGFSGSCCHILELVNELNDFVSGY